MQIGLIDLGRMGGNIVRRSMGRGHQCVVFDRNPSAMTALVEEGAARSDDLRDLVGKLAALGGHIEPRAPT